MTPLRQKMIDAMLLRGFSDRTQDSYLRAVIALAKHYHRPPEELSREQLQQWILHMVKERKASGSTCSLHLCALKFLYIEVLGWEAFELNLVIPKRAQRIPELLSREEVRRILDACTNYKHFTLLSTCYACGLRVSELVQLQTHHIDSARHVLRVEQGKGKKDRHVALGHSLQALLNHYIQRYRPEQWLFFSRTPQEHLATHTAQGIYKRLKAMAGIKKHGGIHSLRHAYATHQLEAGVPVNQLQRLMGHKDLHTTLRYLHWSPNLPQAVGVDLLTGLARIPS